MHAESISGVRGATQSELTKDLRASVATTSFLVSTGACDVISHNPLPSPLPRAKVLETQAVAVGVSKVGVNAAFGE